MKTTTANPVTSEMSRSRTTFMVKLALMVAIIFVMAFSPLGYLRTPGLTITFLTVPVAVGAIILGPTAGAICGGAFGLTSAIMALTGGSAFSAALLQINPFGLLFTVLVPRILEGWLCGLIFAALKKVFKNGAFIIASLACPLLNTLLFSEYDLFIRSLIEKLPDAGSKALQDVHKGGDGRGGQIALQLGNKSLGKLGTVRQFLLRQSF